MSPEFVKEYYTPFLEYAIKDKKLDIGIIQSRKKRGKKGGGKEIESPCIRAIIKRYVDVNKERELKRLELKEEGKENGTNNVENS